MFMSVHHQLFNRHDLTLGDASVKERVHTLALVEHDLIYRSFISLLGFYFNCVWWVLSAVAAAVCLITWSGFATIIFQVLIVSVFAFALALSGFLKTANLRAGARTFTRTYLRVSFMIVAEVAFARFLIH
jgi:hypothetical protein